MNESQPLDCRPYGADPNPKGTKRLRPPCLECPTFERKQLRVKLRTIEPVPMISECRQCQARLDYADAMDPSRNRYVPGDDHAERLEAGKHSGYSKKQGPGLRELLGQRAACMGWHEGYLAAFNELRADGNPWRIIGKLFGISANSARKIHTKEI